jgi:hypothetical protein
MHVAWTPPVWGANNRLIGHNATCSQCVVIETQLVTAPVGLKTMTWQPMLQVCCMC